MSGYGSTLGLYRPGAGFLYRLHLAPKAAVAVIGAAVVVAVREPPLTAVGLCVVLVALLVGAGLRLRQILRMLLPAAPVLVILCVYQVLTQGRVQAFVVVGGIVVCILAARALTLTTPLQDLLDGVARVVQPLRHVGADPERFALALSIMLRSIPYLAGLFVDVRNAARARGLERNPRVAVTPVVLGAVAYAHRTGEALAARGLGDAEAEDHDDHEQDPPAGHR